MTTIDLNRAAEVLRVHPRTVLRAVTEEKNPYWAPGHDERLDLDRVERAFDVDHDVFRRCWRGRDDLLTQPEAAELIEVPLRTFRYRRYPKAVERGRIVRYSRMIVVNHHLDNFLTL